LLLLLLLHPALLTLLVHELLLLLLILLLLLLHLLLLAHVARTAEPHDVALPRHHLRLLALAGLLAARAGENAVASSGT
jgi:hypothetical protein